jgi:hypothetical protein
MLGLTIYPTIRKSFLLKAHARSIRSNTKNGINSGESRGQKIKGYTPPEVM